MKSQNKDSLREMQLAFIGKLMAGLSHEFKNHLAIIKELNGLIEDLLMLEEPGQEADSDRYKKITSGINERVGQAAEMCRFLSGFSHRMDHPLASMNVAEVLQEKIYLLSRFSRQKQVDLVSSFAEDLPQIFNNPALLQFAIFCIIWPALELLEPASRIVISALRKEQSVEIVISLKGKKNRQESETSWEKTLPEIMEILKAELTRRVNKEENKEIVITLASVDSSSRKET